MFTTRRKFGALVLGGLAAPALTGRASAQAVRLRYANASGDTATANIFMRRFFDELAERSGGAIEGQLILNAGSEQSLLESVSLGTMDLANTAYTGLSEFDIFYTPSLLRDADHALRVTQLPVMDRARAALGERYGVRLVGLGSSGSFLLGANADIASWQDFNGLAIRVPSFESYPEACRMLGIAPTPVAFNETYLALQQGLVAGLATLLNVMIASKFVEVCRNVVTNDFGVGIEKIVMSEAAWSRLDASQQELFQATMDEMIAPHYWEAAKSQLAVDFDTWRAANGEDSIITLDGAELTELVQPVAQAAADRVFGEGAYDEISAA